MTMIKLSIDKETRQRNVGRLKANGILLPTFAQMREPEKIPRPILARLAEVGLWDVNPLNLFRDLDAQWYDSPDYWLAIQSQVEQIDNAIRDFNHETGLG